MIPVPLGAVLCLRQSIRGFQFTLALISEGRSVDPHNESSFLVRGKCYDCQDEQLSRESLAQKSFRGKVTTTTIGFGKVNYKAILDEADDGGGTSAPRRRGKIPRVMEAHQ